MTSRMNLAYVAIAALALMMSGVSAARAATQFCDIYPERCQYSGNGGYYYYPQGYRVGSAGRSATNGAAWGCVATDGKATGGSWSLPNRAAASYGALYACARRGGHCHVITCSSSVHNREEARAILFSTTHR
jgi:hypothetical protein